MRVLLRDCPWSAHFQQLPRKDACTRGSEGSNKRLRFLSSLDTSSSQRRHLEQCNSDYLYRSQRRRFNRGLPHDETQMKLAQPMAWSGPKHFSTTLHLWHKRSEFRSRTYSLTLPMLHKTVHQNDKVERTNVKKLWHRMLFRIAETQVSIQDHLGKRRVEPWSLPLLSSIFHPSLIISKTRTEEHGLWTEIMDVIMISQQSMTKELTKKELVKKDGTG